MARVMIVDDAEFMRMVIKETLMKHGHEVVAEMAEREEVIQKYLETKPDFVIDSLINEFPAKRGVYFGIDVLVFFY